MSKINWITKQEDINYILQLDEKQLSISNIIKLFGEFNGKRRFNTTDYIKIPKGTYKNNQKEGVTTVGIWVFNKLLIEPKLHDFLGYVNKEITGDDYGNLNEKLSYGYMEDKITQEQLKDFLMKCELLMSLTSILSANDSLAMMTIPEKIAKKKAELVKKHKDELQRGNEIVSEQIEKELLDYCAEILKDDPAMETYTSKAKGTFTNNFKTIFVMKGAVLNPDTGKDFNIAMSSFMEGIKKDEFHIMANSLAGGPYSRAKKTEVGGYWEKLLLNAYQHVISGPKNSDCGTKRTITVSLNSKNVGDWMYSYIVDGNKLVELTSDNKDKYIGKTVKIRYSSLCESKNYICNKCIGEMFYKLGIQNIGMLTPKAASKIKLISMKAFHDGSVVTTEMNPMRAFSME